ncbi:MAG: class I SAM-dependent methyltransferase [Bradymonadaceae bacterium]
MLMQSVDDKIRFHDRKLAKKYEDGSLPMATFYEAYFDGRVDLPEDEGIYDVLDERDRFVNYRLTLDHFKWAITNFLPEVLIHSKDQDKRIVQEHYDRGNDFFEWFLGERMVYTSGFFEDPDQTLAQGQDNKMNLVCEKLQLEPGDKFLDIGCGWGTLVGHAAKHYGVDAVGVTLAEEQTAYANQRFEEWGIADREEVLCRDYREIPQQEFDKIASLEMVEHVGVKNLSTYYDEVYDLLADDGIFFLQWTGLRRDMGLRTEDLIWGLFMNKYIFPGADASLCPAPMLKATEKAGFEMHSMENVTRHYGWTIRKWHDNWMSNREKVRENYGDRWYRIWHFFLAWSVYVARQGNAGCFQVVMNKNLDEFDRARYVRGESAELGERFSSPLHEPSLETLTDHPAVDESDADEESEPTPMVAE